MTTPPEEHPPSHPLGPQLFRTTQRAEDVQAWAQRMKDKRAARQAAMRGEDATAAPMDNTYWSTDALYAESRHVADEEAHDASTRTGKHQLLASLGLGPDATPQEVTQAVRALAKLHHPDRYSTSSTEVQAHHAEEMARINTAYQALKALGKSGW